MPPLVIIYNSSDDASSMGSDELDQPLSDAVTSRTDQGTRPTMRVTPPMMQYKGVDWRAIQDALMDTAALTRREAALTRREVRVSMRGVSVLKQH